MEGEGDWREELEEVRTKLAKLNRKGAVSAKNSADHCALQIKFWRLTGCLAEKMADKRAASAETERWEKRQQEALRLRSADDYQEVLRRMDELEAQGAALTSLKKKAKGRPRKAAAK